jgi:hypothetical protein
LYGISRRRVAAWPFGVSASKAVICAGAFM